MEIISPQVAGGPVRNPGPARLFWAVGLDGAAAAFAAAEVARLAPQLATPKIRWQPASNWHLTLFFLGNTTMERGLQTAAALRVPLAALTAFDVVVSAAQWFPSQQHPLVVALPVAGSAPLLALASVVTQAVVSADFAHEPRPFRGHVSIARVRRGYRPRDPLPVAAGPHPGVPATLRVDHLSLYESLSTGDGARYQPILTLPLRAASR